MPRVTLSESLYIDVTPAEKQWAKALADKQGVSVTRFMRSLLHTYIRNQQSNIKVPEYETSNG